jgi:hypothetical protein
VDVFLEIERDSEYSSNGTSGAMKVLWSNRQLCAVHVIYKHESNNIPFKINCAKSGILIGLIPC